MVNVYNRKHITPLTITFIFILDTVFHESNINLRNGRDISLRVVRLQITIFNTGRSDIQNTYKIFYLFYNNARTI